MDSLYELRKKKMIELDLIRSKRLRLQSSNNDVSELLIQEGEKISEIKSVNKAIYRREHAKK